jgi:hypothetical protein
MFFTLEGFIRFKPSLVTVHAEQPAPRASPLDVAKSLNNLGVMPGDKVGVIGYGYDSFWARLARVKIVAELLDKDAVDLWYADEELWQSVLKSFADIGVSAVVAEYVPGDVYMNNWHRVGNSNYFIFRFEN